MASARSVRFDMDLRSWVVIRRASKQSTLANREPRAHPADRRRDTYSLMSANTIEVECESTSLTATRTDVVPPSSSRVKR